MGLTFRLRHLSRVAGRAARRQWRRAANAHAVRIHSRARAGIDRHPPPLPSAREILVIRPDEIGDLVLASAFLRELRGSAPLARITLVVKRSVAPLVVACPHVDRVAIYDWESAMDSADPEPDLRWLARRTARQALSGVVYDYVLLPRRCPDWCEATFLAWCVDSRCVAGSEDALSDVYPQRHHRAHLLDRCFRDDRVQHEVSHGLDYLRWLGGAPQHDVLEVWVPSAAREQARALLRRRFDPARNIIALHPSGGRSKLKQWPLERFQALARELAVTDRAQLLVVGGPDEAEKFRAAFPASLSADIHVVAGELPLPLMAAALAEVSLFVGGDSGPAHLAAAQGTPTLALFGPTSEVRFAPRGAHARVLSARIDCSPDRSGTFIDRCHTCVHSRLLCMESLEVRSVLAEVRCELQRHATPRPPASTGSPEFLPTPSP